MLRRRISVYDTRSTWPSRNSCWLSRGSFTIERTWQSIRCRSGPKLDWRGPVRLPLIVALATLVTILLCATSSRATIVSDWNAATLAEVRLSRSLRNGPPIVARALAIAHTCMYDAWAAYDAVAVGTTDTDLPGS